MCINKYICCWAPNKQTQTHHCSQDDAEQYSQLCSYIAIAKKTLLICKGSEQFPASHKDKVGKGANAGVVEVMKGHIDVWWIFDLFPSNGLMLLLPYLLQQHKVWKK
jgi:hypothetical protein